MILADTSIWVDHLRTNNRALAVWLENGQVLTHPFIIGELALGNLSPRHLVLNALSRLARAAVATDAEVLAFIERHSLFGLGIGYVDAHLLAAVRLTAGARLWTKDKKLQAVAVRVGLAITTPRPSA